MSVIEVSGAGFRKKRTSVYVGNIPHDATEQQLTELFQTVGPVVSFRLMMDRETCKRKGFGFCDFVDEDSAASAVRNLDQYEFLCRALRVSFADKQGQMLPPPKRPQDSKDIHYTYAHERKRDWQQDDHNVDEDDDDMGRNDSKHSNASIIGAGLDSRPLVYDEQRVSKIVGALSASQRLEILVGMQAMIKDNLPASRHLLRENPDVACAMSQLLLLFNVVRPEDVASLLRPVPSSSYHDRALCNFLPLPLLSVDQRWKSTYLEMPNVAPQVGLSGNVQNMVRTSITQPSPNHSSYLSAVNAQMTGRNPVVHPYLLAETPYFPKTESPMSFDDCQRAPHLQNDQSHRAPSPQSPPPTQPLPYLSTKTNGSTVSTGMSISQLPPEQQRLLAEVQRMSPDQVQQLPRQIQEQVQSLKAYLGALRRPVTPALG